MNALATVNKDEFAGATSGGKPCIAWVSSRHAPGESFIRTYLVHSKRIISFLCLDKKKTL